MPLASLVHPLEDLEAPQPKTNLLNLDFLFTPGGKDKNYLELVFFTLLTCVQIRQTTIIDEAGEINANAAVQNYLNKQDLLLRYEELPPKATTSEINSIQIYNQEISALKAGVENMIITARQDGQVTMTHASTNVDLLQQNAAADTRVLRIIYALFQSIIKMGPQQ